MQRKNEAYWSESQQRWQINVQSDGVRKTFVSSKKLSQPDNKKGKIEAEKKADKWLESQHINGNARTDKMLDAWLETVKNATSKTNYCQYSSIVKIWVKPLIGRKKCAALTKADLQNVINTAYAKKQLAEKTLKNIRGVLVTFMAYCRDSNAATLFPDRLKIPDSAKRPSKQILAPGDLTKLFTSSITTKYGKKCDDWYIHAYRFLVLTGMRPGEMMGLTNKDVSGDAVYIRRSINRYNQITQGKNKNAIRSFKIGAYAQAELAAQKDMLTKAGVISNYVFPAPDLDHINQHHLYTCWKRYCEANSFQRCITPYELRHTFVSITDEMPTAFKKMIVGHSKSMDTEGIYGHKKQGDMDKAVGYIDAAFSEHLGKTGTH